MMHVLKWSLLGILAVVAVVGAAAIGATWMTASEVPAAATEPLPVLYEAPDFTLTDQDGEAFRSRELDGQVWVADFIFTDCPTICPVLSSHMASLQDWLKQRDLAERVHLVSISVDPENDTPAVLREFAETHGADFDHWTFLTATADDGEAGPRDRIWRLVEQGFKLPVAENAPGAEMPIMHSPKLVLVDAKGQIRGYYAGTTPKGQENLRADLRAVLNQ
jgi:protein SCO1/2